MSLANELRDEFAGLGATDKTAAIETVKRELESGHRIATVLTDRAEQLRSRAAALRSSDGAAGRSEPVPVPASQGGRPPGVPRPWRDSPADNGKGRVWQRPGSRGNADTLRTMEPTERYPYGYIRFYNQFGQPIGLDGKPGSRSETHIPVRKDGTYDIPQGWHHDED
ncbi:hypothetical protein [Glycomyces arizonensis]|uniref:hypothetical protein n=1 Tax=Glycomyces arizonensis TaxID=256035 RepID=UPI0012EBDDFD|nr:hypothetical protein [Glycomyces arizonensis]